MFRTILWATDGSPSADAALQYAKALAEGDGGKLVAVHCNELMHGRAAGHPLRADEPEIVEKIREQVEAAREEDLDASLQVLRVAAGGAANAIAHRARELDADVIVVGRRGHAPLGGLLLGSVTQRLLHTAPCAVLTVPNRGRLRAAGAGVTTVAAAERRPG